MTHKLSLPFLLLSLFFLSLPSLHSSAAGPAPTDSSSSSSSSTGISSSSSPSSPSSSSSDSHTGASHPSSPPSPSPSHSNANSLNAPSHHYSFPSFTRFSFGSCSKADHDQPLWSPIISDSPSFFLWLGDIIYADNSLFQVIRWPATPSQVFKQFQIQKSRSDYQHFQKSISPILGISDDHDFGENDGDSTYRWRAESQISLLNFLSEPANSVRHQRAGVYGAYSFHSENHNKTMKLILLDGRYHQKRTSGDLLGSQQWEWLTRQLDFTNQRDRAVADEEVDRTRIPDLLVIGISFQLLPRERRIGENWGNFPRSRTRLLEMLTPLNVPIVFVSGDPHIAEVLETDVCVPNHSLNPNHYNIRHFIEMTSSGMTHTWEDLLPNSLHDWGLSLMRIIFGDKQKNGHWNDGSDEGKTSQFYTGLQYGLMDINWEGRMVTLSVRGKDGEDKIKYNIPFSYISPHQITVKPPKGVESDKEYRHPHDNNKNILLTSPSDDSDVSLINYNPKTTVYPFPPDLPTISSHVYPQPSLSSAWKNCQAERRERYSSPINFGGMKLFWAVVVVGSIGGWIIMFFLVKVLKPLFCGCRKERKLKTE